MTTPADQSRAGSFRSSTSSDQRTSSNWKALKLVHTPAENTSVLICGGGPFQTEIQWKFGPPPKIQTAPFFSSFSFRAFARELLFWNMQNVYRTIRL